MRRIAIVGCSGSGKSTLARELGERLGLPVIHMDTLFWKPGWTESEPEAFESAVTDAASAENWIMEGGYIRASTARFTRADTVIWIEAPTWLCLWRAFARSVANFGRPRADLAPGCPERIDPAFYRYIWNWNRLSRPRMAKALAEHAAGARLVRLRTGAEAARFLAEAGGAEPG